MNTTIRILTTALILSLSSCVKVNLDTPLEIDPIITPSLSIGNAPSGQSAVTNLNVNVTGNVFVSFRYKVGLSITTDCANASGYSSEMSISSLITDDISALPDGEIIICIIGKDNENSWQSFTSAITTTWMKSTPLKILFRSLGPGLTASLASGTSNALSITNNVATFDSGLPNNVGVGDAIQYDSNNDTLIDAVAFIRQRISANTFLIQNAAGNNPLPTSNDQTWSIFRAYTNLNNLMNGTENTGIDLAVRNFDTSVGSRDLIVNNEQWHVALYADAVDSGTYGITNWTTGPDNYFRLFTPVSPNEVGVSQRHSGIIGTGYHLNGSITFRLHYGRVEGLSITSVSNANNDSTLHFSPLGGSLSTHYALNNVLKGTGAHNELVTLRLSDGSNLFLNSVYVVNNILVDEGTGSDTRAFYVSLWGDGSGGNDKVYIYNNTMISLNNHGLLRNAADLDLRNNLVSAPVNTLGDWGGDGTILPVSSNNAHTVATASLSPSFGGGSMSRELQTFTFVDPLNDDYRLSTADTGAQGFGADLSNNGIFNFSDDVIGTSRSTTWDIGASTAY